VVLYRSEAADAGIAAGAAHQRAHSADAVYFEPDSLESNQPEGPVTDAKYVEEICALLRQLEPADDVVWPAEEEQYLFPRRPLCCFPAMAARN